MAKRKVRKVGKKKGEYRVVRKGRSKKAPKRKAAKRRVKKGSAPAAGVSLWTKLGRETNFPV
jgi:hypothetical protein